MDNAVMPGLIIKRELEAHGWSQADLAFILGRQPPEISGLISGKRSISPEIAVELASALGHSVHYWLSLEAAYAASQMKAKNDLVTRRLKLYEAFPVRDMIKRSWIEPSQDIDVLEQRVFTFLGINSVNEKPRFDHAARKSTSYLDTTPAQSAWIIRVRQLAKGIMTEKFSDKSLKNGLDRLKMLLQDPEEIRHVPRILAEAGIRLVLVETLSTTRIDGICTWLDKQSPVIGLSLRYDRIDSFWHTVFHETDHLSHREGQDVPILDTNLVGEDRRSENEKPENEKRADAFAADSSIKKADLDNFIARIHPLYSAQRIKAFAATKHVHPGIVVGQLQYRGKIPYSHHRELLVKVRHLLVESTMTDGWGYKPSIKVLT